MYSVTAMMNEKRRGLNEAASPSQVERALETTAHKFLKPLKKNPVGFAAAYLDAIGKEDITVGEVVRKLKAMKRKLEQQAARDPKIRDEVKSLGESLGPDGMLIEGFWSTILDMVAWAGKTLGWAVGKFVSFIMAIVDSWFGRNPIGRLLLGILILGFGPSIYTQIYILLGITLPWYVPVAFGITITIHIISETINSLGLISSTESLSAMFIETSSEARPIKPFSSVTKPLGWFFRGIAR